MRKIPNREVLRQGLAISVLLSVVAACNGSGSSASDATATSGTGATPATMLFEQPQEGGIAGQLVVPNASGGSPVPEEVFALVLWQPNRFQSNGLLVPTGWDAGSRTGFTPANPSTAQLGFQDVAGSSAAQAQGDTVGAYLNSSDLPPSSADQKMMITPEYRWVAGSEPVPFSSSQSSLSGSMDLQIPVATGTDAYVVLDYLFTAPDGKQISYGIKVFHNGSADNAVGTSIDGPTGNYELNSPLGIIETYVTHGSDSAVNTGTPWSGWQHFDWSISQAQFAAALQFLNATYPGVFASLDPSQYMLSEVHLNAEFHTQGQPAQLGWSMTGLKVWTAP
jgi:hypothetical protein